MNRAKGYDQRWNAQRELGAVTPGPTPPAHDAKNETIETRLGQITRQYDHVAYFEIQTFDQWHEYRATVDNATPFIAKFDFPAKKVIVKNNGLAATLLFFSLHDTNVNTVAAPGVGGSSVLQCEGQVERVFDGLAGLKAIALLSDQAGGIAFRVTIFG